MNNRYHFFYQPRLIFTVIDWCWTFITLLTGIIFWLEVTHFQWITLLFFIIFFILAGSELFCRQLIIKSHFLLVFNFCHYRWRIFDLRFSAIQIKKHYIIIQNNKRKFSCLISYRSGRRIKQFLSH